MIKQTLVVLGACGAQGKSVIEHVKSLPNWKVIGLTHRPDCEQAKSMQDDPNVEIIGFIPLQSQLTSLLMGADVVFASAYDWDPHLHLDNEEFELRFGREIISSCEKAQVKHVIWSSLFNAKPDKLKSSSGEEAAKKTKKPIETPESFESKHQLEELLTGPHKTSSSLKWTILYSGFFMENFQKFTPFEQVENKRNQFVLRALPYLHKNTELPLFDVHDMGIVVRSLLLADYQNFASMKLCVYAEKKTVTQAMADFARIMHADTVTLERAENENNKKNILVEQLEEDQRRRSSEYSNKNYITRELIDVLHWFKHDGYRALEQACAQHNSSILSSKFKASSSSGNEIQQQQERQLLVPWSSSTSSLTSFEKWLGQQESLFVDKSSSTSA